VPITKLSQISQSISRNFLVFLMPLDIFSIQKPNFCLNLNQKILWGPCVSGSSSPSCRCKVGPTCQGYSSTRTPCRPLPPRGTRLLALPLGQLIPDIARSISTSATPLSISRFAVLSPKLGNEPSPSTQCWSHHGVLLVADP
jgi:hypothetical protein